MLFNSLEFLFIFLPITFFVYFYLNAQLWHGASKLFIVLASLFFYSWWNIDYLPIIISSILFNYYFGVFLGLYAYRYNPTIRKVALALGISANIALLGYFKYSDFLISSVNRTFDQSYETIGLLLPLAISFFTFQQIAYLVDSYRHKAHETSLLNYSLFVSFFPQLIAGPIVHHKEMMPQFISKENRFINYKNIALGMFIFSIGLFKKVVIADSLSPYVEQGFDISQSLNLIEAWTTSLSYTFQLYFDFSGYADMAIGLALLFNIRLPINFNSPYQALNIQDFWRRWHITLSRFLKDYVYIPMGGNRGSGYKTYSNLFATFVIGGIWHGAGLMFVLWGALHGAAIVMHRLWSKTKITLPAWLAWLITFNFINVTWVFFRATEWNDAVKVINGMFNFSGLSNIFSVNLYNFYDKFQLSDPYTAINLILDYLFSFSLLFLLLFVLLSTNTKTKLTLFNPSIKNMFATILLLSIALLHLYDNSSSEFLYFNF